MRQFRTKKPKVYHIIQQHIMLAIIYHHMSHECIIEESPNLFKILITKLIYVRYQVKLGSATGSSLCALGHSRIQECTYNESLNEKVLNPNI